MVGFKDRLGVVEEISGDIKKIVLFIVKDRERNRINGKWFVGCEE